MNRLYTVKDFKFGDVGIKFSGNNTLLSKIINEIGIRSQRTEFKSGHGADKYIYVDVEKGVIINTNCRKDTIEFVSEENIYFTNGSMHDDYNIKLSELIDYLYNKKYRGQYVAALRHYAVVELRKKGLSYPVIADTLNLSNHTHAMYYENSNDLPNYYQEPYWYKDFLRQANNFIRKNKIPIKKHNGGLEK